MILGIGSDLIAIRRVEKSIERFGERFLGLDTGLGIVLVYPGKPLRQLGVEPIELGLRVTSGVVGREHFTLHFPRATAEGCGRGPRRRVVVPRE